MEWQWGPYKIIKIVGFSPFFLFLPPIFSGIGTSGAPEITGDVFVGPCFFLAHRSRCRCFDISVAPQPMAQRFRISREQLTCRWLENYHEGTFPKKSVWQLKINSSLELLMKQFPRKKLVFYNIYIIHQMFCLKTGSVETRFPPLKKASGK